VPVSFGGHHHPPLSLGHVVSSAASVNCFFFLILGCFLNRYAGIEVLYGAYKKVVVRTIYVLRWCPCRQIGETVDPEMMMAGNMEK
jgi:hypothetical protein